MIDTITIQKKMCINPEFLGKNLVADIFEYVKGFMKDDCSKDLGYIVKVKKIKRIIDNCISGNNGELIFEIEILVDVIKPEIGKLFTDKVCMIYNGGIFLDIKGKFKILIPISSLQHFVYDTSKKCFQKGDFTIKEGDLITSKITGIKFSKNNFSCFGNILL